jgi:hypothetical protein
MGISTAASFVLIEGPALRVELVEKKQRPKAALDHLFVCIFMKVKVNLFRSELTGEFQLVLICQWQSRKQYGHSFYGL